MSCTNSKALVASLMSDINFARKFSELSSEISNLKLRLKSDSVSNKSGLEFIIQEKESLLETFILGTGLRNPQTKLGFLRTIKKSKTRGGIKKAIELIEVIDTSEGFEAIKNFTSDFDGLSLSKQQIEERVIKYIENDSIISSRYKANSKNISDLKKLYNQMGQDAGKIAVQGAMFTQGGGAGLTKALDIAKNIGKKNFESTLDDVTQQATTSSNVKKIEEFTIGYAPFREGNIKNISDVNFNNMGKKYQDRLDLSQEMSKMFGVSISKQNKSVGIYSTTSDLGEASQYNTVMGTKEDVEAFAAMMGTLAPDIQDSVLIGRYSAKGKGKEIRFDVKGDVQEFIQSMKENGLSDMSYIPETKTIVLIDSDNSFGKSQLNFISTSYKNGQITKPRNRYSDIRFIGENEYGGILEIYERKLTDRGDGAVGMTELRDAISYAKDKSRRGSLSFRKELAKKRKEALDGVLGYIEKNKKSLGLEDYKPTKVKKIDTEYANKIAESFDNVIDYNDVKATNEYKKKVKESYESLSKEVELQYKFLTSPKSEGGLGIKIEFIKDDPYKSSEEMMEDVLRNNRLKIYQGGEPNEFMSKVDETGLSTNEKFRAVHDYFGHFVEMNSFGQVGEEGARVAHSKMFSKKARGALTIETRGQNSWVNSPGKNDESKKLFIEGNSLIQKGKISEGLFKKEKGGEIFQYAEQKTGLLPEEFVSYEKYVTDKSEYTDFNLISREDIETLKITEEISKKIDIKKITEDDIYNIDNIGDLEKLVQYNIDDFIYGENKTELFSVFSQKLDELKLKADYENILQKQDVTPQEKSLISHIGNLISIQSDINFNIIPTGGPDNAGIKRRIEARFGRRLNDGEVEEIRKGFLGYLKNGTSFNISGIEVNNSNIHDFIGLFGAKELSYISRLESINVEEIATLIKIGPSSRMQLIDAIVTGNEKKFLELIVNNSGETVGHRTTPAEISYYINGGIDLDKKIVHLDFSNDYYKGASEKAKSRGYKQYEAQHNQQQITTYKAPGFNSIEGLKKFVDENVEDGETIIVLLPQIKYANSKQLLEYSRELASLGKKGKSIIYKASDIAGQNFSFGYRDGYITLRAKNSSVFSELQNTITQARGQRVEVLEEPLLEAIESMQTTKAKDLVNLSFDNVDISEVRSSITIEQITKEFNNYMRNIGYNVPENVTINESFENIREIYLDFAYTPLDNEKLKRVSANKLRDIFGYGNSKRIYRHQHLSQFMDLSTSDGWDIPLNGVKEFIESYLKTGVVNKEFVKKFAATNQQLLIERKGNAEDIINLYMEKVSRNNVGGKIDEYIPTRREGIQDVVKNGPTETLNNVKSFFIQKGKSTKAKVDYSIYLRGMNDILSDYGNRVEKAIISGASVEELDKMRFELYQVIDEFEYGVYKDLGHYVKPSDRGAFFGGKFSIGGVYTKEDLELLTRQISDYNLSFGSTIERVKKSIKDINEGNSTIKMYEVNGKKMALDLDDQIIDVIGKVSKDSELGNLKGITREGLSILKEEDKLRLLNIGKQTVLDDVNIKGLILNRLEAQSLYLSNIGFSKNYKKTMTKFGLLPESLIDNEIRLPFWNNDIDLEIKTQIFDGIGAIVSKNTFDIEKNLDNMDKYILEKVDSFVNKVINDKKYNLKNEDIVKLNEDIRDQITLQYQVDFMPYAHITPINKDFIEQARQIYGVEGGGKYELNEYLPKKEKTTLGVDVDNYEGLDEGVKDFFQEGDNAYIKRLKKEILGLSETSQLMNAVNRRFFQYYSRDVMQQNPNTRKIYEAFISVSQQVEDAENAMNIVFNGAYNWRYIFDKNSLLGDKILRVSGPINRGTLELIQKKVDDLMLLTDADFSRFGNEVVLSEELAAYNMALLYRRLRSALGTNGAGKGPTNIPQFNDAIHNLYTSFTTIKGTDEQVYKRLSSLLSSNSSLQLFRGLAGSPQKEIRDIFNELAGVGDNGIDSSRIGQDFEIISNEGINTKSSIILNNLFGSQFNNIESSLIAQSLTGVSRQSLGRVGKGISYLGGTIKSFPTLPILKTVGQFGANVLAGTGTVLGYVSLLGKSLRGYSKEELEFAGQLRQAIGFGNEVQDLTRVYSGIAKGEDLGKYGLKNDLEDGLFNRIAGIVGNDVINDASIDLINGNRVSATNKILGKIRRVTTQSLVGSKTREVLFLNGQNWVDIIFSGIIKNIATIDAIKSNSYRGFSDIDEMRGFLETASKEESDRLMNSIRAKANKSYNDRAGTNFNTFNQAINPYTGLKGAATDVLFGIRNSMAYLNGRGLSITRNFMRTLEQTARLTRYNMKDPSSAKFIETLDWVKKTPEYRAYMSLITSDILNSIRVMRFDDDREDGDLGLSQNRTFEKFYRAFKTLSIPYQAFSIVGINRPIVKAFEEYTSEDVDISPVEAFQLEFLKNAFSVMTIESNIANLVKRMIANPDQFDQILSDYITDAAGGSIRYRVGKYFSGGRLLVPDAKNSSFSILGIDETGFSEDAFYTSADVEMVARLTGLGNNNDFEYSIQLLKELLNNRTLGKAFGKTYGGKLLFNADNIITLQNAMEGKETYEEAKQKGYVTIKNGNQLKTFESYFIRDNPFMDSMTDKALLDKMNEYIDTGTITGDEYATNSIGLQMLFDDYGKDGLQDLLTKTEKMVSANRPKKDADADKMHKEIIINDFKGKVIATDKSYKQQLGAMIDIAEEINGKIDKGSNTEDIAFKIDAYNEIMPKLSQMNEVANKKFVMQSIIKAHGEEINKSAGRNYFEQKKDEKTGEKYRTISGNWKNYIQQELEISKDINEGNFEGAMANMNILVGEKFADNDLESGAAALGISGIVNKVMTSDLFTEKQKIELIGKIGGNNFDTIFKNMSLLTDKGIDVNTILKPFFDTHFKLESMLSEELRDIKLDEKSVKGKGGGKGGGSGGAKVGKVDYDKLLKFKNTLSKGLDKFRADYKLQGFKPSAVEAREGYRKGEIKRKYPISGTAKTKTPAGLAAESKKQTKDISRTIKKKKRKLPKPLV